MEHLLRSQNSSGMKIKAECGFACGSEILNSKPKFNPRVSVVYSPVNQHNFRVSFQNGFRFPSLFEALSFVNNGNVRRVGGLPMVNEGLGYLDNSYTLSSIDRFTSAVNADTDAGKVRIRLHWIIKIFC